MNTNTNLAGSILAFHHDYTNRTKYIIIDSGICPGGDAYTKGVHFDYNAPLATSTTLLGRKVTRRKDGTFNVGNTFTTISLKVLGRNRVWMAAPNTGGTK